jgi:hypothetical protein
MIDEDVELRTALRRAAIHLASQQAPPRVLESLLPRLRVGNDRRRGWLAMAVAAAFAFAFALLSVHLLPRPKAEPAPFISLAPNGERVSLESGMVIDVTMTAAELTALGVEVHTDDITREVPVELLVGQDGVPRAIRRRTS